MSASPSANSQPNSDCLSTPDNLREPASSCWRVHCVASNRSRVSGQLKTRILRRKVAKARDDHRAPTPHITSATPKDVELTRHAGFCDLNYSFQTLGISLRQPPLNPSWPDRSTARRCGGAMWRCSPHRGVGHDPASPTHDRGYADPEPGPSDSGLLRRTSQQVNRFARHFHKSPELLGPTEIRYGESTWPAISAWQPVPSLSLWRPCCSFIPSPFAGHGP